MQPAAVGAVNSRRRPGATRWRRSAVVCGCCCPMRLWAVCAVPCTQSRIRQMRDREQALKLANLDAQHGVPVMASLAEGLVRRIALG